MVVIPIPTELHSNIYGPPQGQWTYADWETLPDDGNRYEVINGVLYMTTAPSPMHQWAILMLYELVGIPARKQGLAYTYVSPIGVIMPECDPVQPDLVMIRKERINILNKKRINGVPDLIAEFISPGSTSYDEDIKLKAYARAGVPEYVVIEHSAQVLRYYALIEPGTYADPQSYTADQTVEFGCAPGITVRVGDLFEGAPDTTL